MPSVLNEFEGDGISTVFNLSILDGYINKSFIKFYTRDTDDLLDWQAVTSLTPIRVTWTGEYSIQTNVPVPSGTVLVAMRETPLTPLVDFTNQSRITERNLDLGIKQPLHKVAELSDLVDRGTEVARVALVEAQDAVDLAESAVETAEQADTKADTAIVNAGMAVSASAQAQAAASLATTAANNALEASGVAQAAAVNAATAASTATGNAVAAQNAAQAAQGAAQAAASSATSAQSQASDAASSASAAYSLASAANSTATSASTNASTALNTANSALSTAQSANITAGNAQSTATAAQSQAGTAASTASNALTAANSAVTMAGNAVTQAGEANTVATNAAMASQTAELAAQQAVQNAAGALQAALDALSQVESAVAGSVVSFNGRDGAVVPMAGDYAIADITGLAAELAGKMSTITAGANISINAGVISATDTTYDSMTEGEIIVGAGTTARTITPARLKAAINTHAPAQITYTAGSNIQIVGGVISATDTDTKYTAGSNVQISGANVISATDTTYSALTTAQVQSGTSTASGVVSPARMKEAVLAHAPAQTTYTAGSNVQISSSNVISATDTKYNVASTSTQGLMSATDKAKLNGIAVNATANMADNVLLNRQNHTGMQEQSTIVGLDSRLVSIESALYNALYVPVIKSWRVQRTGQLTTGYGIFTDLPCRLTPGDTRVVQGILVGGVYGSIATGTLAALVATAFDVATGLLTVNWRAVGSAGVDSDLSAFNGALMATNFGITAPVFAVATWGHPSIGPVGSLQWYCTSPEQESASDYLYPESAVTLTTANPAATLWASSAFPIAPFVETTWELQLGVTNSGSGTAALSWYCDSVGTLPKVGGTSVVLPARPSLVVATGTAPCQAGWRTGSMTTKISLQQGDNVSIRRASSSWDETRIRVRRRLTYTYQP